MLRRFSEIDTDSCRRSLSLYSATYAHITSLQIPQIFPSMPITLFVLTVYCISQPCRLFLGGYSFGDGYQRVWWCAVGCLGSRLLRSLLIYLVLVQPLYVSILSNNAYLLTYRMYVTCTLRSFRFWCVFLHNSAVYPYLLPPTPPHPQPVRTLVP